MSSNAGAISLATATARTGGHGPVPEDNGVFKKATEWASWPPRDTDRNHAYQERHPVKRFDNPVLRYLSSSRPWILLLSVTLIALILLSIDIRTGVYISFDILNYGKAHTGYFYIDTGNGFSEKLKTKFSYKRQNTILLTYGPIKYLRFDPMDNKGRLTITNMIINGKRINFLEHKVIPLHNTSIKIIDKNTITIISSGPDPYLILSQDIISESKFTFDFKFFFFSTLLVLCLLVDYESCKRKGYHGTPWLYSFLLLHLIFLLAVFLYAFDIGDFPQPITGKAWALAGLFREFVTIYILIILFTTILKLRHTPLAIAWTYTTINTAQAISVCISGGFITRLALANMEFADYLVTPSNLLIAIANISLSILLPIIIARRYHSRIRNIVHGIAISLGATLLIARFGSIGAPESLQATAILNRLKIDAIAPVQNIVHALSDQPKPCDLSLDDIYDIEKLFGFTIDKHSRYPFTKSRIYAKSLYDETIPAPNIILIFTEGYSARTCNAYSNTFQDLTPNLRSFAEEPNTLIVTGYYNHTAATYRGIHGQLCSLYPTFGGVGGWSDSMDKLPRTRYLCLPHILDKYGYDTIYLNVHYKDASHIDEMVANFGFARILSAEKISISYLGGINRLKNEALTDHQAYNGLLAFLKRQRHQPFFVAMYTEGTHAWLNTPEDGIYYKDGQNISLNTIHDMDDAFGYFWRYFKRSKYHDNTLVIFTSDHAHYYSKSYVEAMQAHNEADYQKIFTDKVPLLIYNPLTNPGEKIIHAHSATSISLTPTILHLADINQENSFLGHSIFERKNINHGISSYGGNTYIIRSGNIVDEYSVSPEERHVLDLARKFITYEQNKELKNRIIGPALLPYKQEPR